MLSEHFRTLARFNAWANNEVYDAVATLPAAEIGKPRPAAYFDSILGTLNHLLVVDLLWFGRVAGADPGVTSLDQVLHDDFGVLRKARATEDARIIALVESAGLELVSCEPRGNYALATGALTAQWLLRAFAARSEHRDGSVSLSRWRAPVVLPVIALVQGLYALAGRFSRDVNAALGYTVVARKPA